MVRLDGKSEIINWHGTNPGSKLGNEESPFPALNVRCIGVRDGTERT